MITEERKLNVPVSGSVVEMVMADRANLIFNQAARDAARIDCAGTITLKARASDTGSEKVYDVAKLRDIDAAQDRFTLTGEQVDALVKLIAGGWMLKDAVSDLEPFLKKEGALANAKAASSLADLAYHKIANRYSAAQNIALGNVIADADAYIVCKGQRVPPSAVNVDREAMLTVAHAAMESCGMFCHKSRKQSKNCRLRQAFCMIPGLKESASMDPFQDDAHCLFYLNSEGGDMYGPDD